MPRYDYKCVKCGMIREVQASIDEDIQPMCCGATMERVWTAPVVKFNAPGFYSTGG